MEKKDSINKAVIIFNSKSHPERCDEGCYLLMFNNKMIAQWLCSNRNFANYDLTQRSIEVLNKHNIDEVYSNDKLVWKRDSLNEETTENFHIANYEYEQLNCKSY